ncbi:MAG: hypothetical protein QW767_03355 [Thermoprotei archaeon]
MVRQSPSPIRLSARHFDILAVAEHVAWENCYTVAILYYCVR